MFRRVLVANRGEIARRIIRTLTRMGIESVAVYSKADEAIPYLKEASFSVCIGAAAAKESYLCEEAILEAALQTNCEAIHPGFGFLSENARFATRCRQQKLSFIGPSPELIRLMGDKAQARKTMHKLCVPTLLGSDDVITDLSQLKEQAKTLGYPILLKASAGGGGKGMRLVEKEEDLFVALEQGKREALAAFGDGEMYMEKFVKNARHIEFQVLADNFGHVVVLGERECSVQRKNQKLIEEAPATRLNPETRKATIQVIEQSMKTLGYTNAGTLEFLLGDDGKLYFMEMNTRIQVEHPVTELVSGIDIVEQQIRIAANEPLRFSSGDIVPNGAAIECRINAEDPAQDFLPSPGVIEKLKLPPNSSAGPVRIDTHIEEGFRVQPYYDSMLAKVIAYGKTRSEAVALMQKTLNELELQGINTTVDFHKAILSHPAFVQGTYDCSFIPNNLSQLLKHVGNKHG